MAMNLPPFTLYGLVGCPHCEAAEKFLKVRSIAYWGMVANGDPIIEAGVKAIIGSPDYPILVSRVEGKPKIVKGFKKETYERLVQLLYASADSSVSSLFGSGQQPGPPASVEITDDTDNVTQEEPNPTTKSGRSKKITDTEVM
jgi:glutaredoxin